MLDLLFQLLQPFAHARQATEDGRVTFPIRVGMNGKTLVKWPGLGMDLVIDVPPETVTRSAMVRWPAKLAAPPMMQ